MGQYMSLRSRLVLIFYFLQKRYLRRNHTNNFKDWGFPINSCSCLLPFFLPLCWSFSCSLRSVDLRSRHTRYISTPKNVHRDRRIFHRPLSHHNDYTSYKTPQVFFKFLHMHYELENVKRSKGGETKKLIEVSS